MRHDYGQLFLYQEFFPAKLVTASKQGIPQCLVNRNSLCKTGRTVNQITHRLEAGGFGGHSRAVSVCAAPMLVSVRSLALMRTGIGLPSRVNTPTVSIARDWCGRPFTTTSSEW